MSPKYPVYVVSKGRWQHALRLTTRALDDIGVPYLVVVEDSQADQYAAAVGPERVLVLPESYIENYETLDDRTTIGKGPGPARNFAWDHAAASGAERHWVMDDNIGSFRRMNRNRQIRVTTGAIFRCMEDFVDRYQNVAIAGPQYDFFLPSKYKFPPFVPNTRIYSCLLIDTGIPYRWRGRYNEDTDLCLRVLKDGLCTVQFNAFIQEKKETQGMTGGNTTEFYAKEGTLNKSAMVVEHHPDIARLIWKYGRWHHHINYKPFRSNRLVLREGVVVPTEVNNYGMRVGYVGADGALSGWVDEGVTA